MKKLLRIAALTAGALTLFSVAFLAFAWSRAAGPHELPVVGTLFPEPVAEQGQEPLVVAPPVQRPIASQAGLGLLDVFRVDSPLDKNALATLASDLKARLNALDAREAEQALAEQRLAERAQFLDEQLATINSLRTELERWQTELEQRQAEVLRDEGAKAERDAASWERMAKLFEKGEAPALAAKLGGYPPAEAALILRQLKPERARELLEGLGGESWKDYWDAYRQALGELEP